MRCLILVSALFFVAGNAAPAAPKGAQPASVRVGAGADVKKSSKRVYRERVRGGELEFDVIVRPDENKVDVYPRSDQARTALGDLQFELYSEDEDRTPTGPVTLQAISPPDAGGPRYAGKLDRWNDNYVGFVLSFRRSGKPDEPWQVRKSFTRKADLKP